MTRFTLKSGIRTLYTHRGLLESLVIRDIKTRYSGTILGFLWVLLYPLMMLTVYVLVFGGIFHSRWTSDGDIKDFVLMLYCGLIVHGLLSDTLSRSPTAILANPSYVKKVVFPLELLPISQLVSALFNALIGLFLLAILILIQRQTLSATALLVPLVFLPLLIITAGFAWFLSAVGVFLRDIGQMMGIVMSILMFLSPVFYPISSVPLFAQKIIYLNPLTYPIEELRAVLIVGSQINWLYWSVYFLLSIAVAFFGLFVFQKSRTAFSDVI